MNFGLHLIVFCYGFALYLLSFYINCVYIWEYLLHFFEEPVDQKSFDYIIVGCGTAGSLLAHQLSALGNVSYIGLEAGGYGGPLLHPPVLAPLLQHSAYDWQYKTVPQKNACLGLKNEVCSWPMGKILGGSAKLNNMIHIRGYLNEIVPWFGSTYNINSLEKYLVDLEATDLPYNKMSYKTPVSSAILNAGIEIGFDIIDSNISSSRIGFMEPVLNQVNGARWSTSHTLLNLHTNTNGKILTNAFVHKIVFDESDSSIAKGISFERFGRDMLVYARKGVILSAGAIGSPKILLLSGIGPKEHLKNMNIPVTRDLPVGENLMDHVTTGLDIVLLEKPLDFNLNSFLNPLNLWKYLVNGDGPWTSPGCEAIAFINSDDKLRDNKTFNTPDLQLMVLPLGLSTDYGLHLKNVVGISDYVWENYFSFSRNSITILPIVLQPKSKGKVYLSSRNPHDLPLIDPMYFTETDDIEVILYGIDFIKKILETESMKNLGAKLNSIPFPGCESNEFDTRDYWTCYVKHLTLTTFHPVGTCKMGSMNDETSVVNYDFSVKGTKNLYVVDASIFPTMVSGNTNMAVALVAKIFSQMLVQ